LFSRGRQAENTPMMSPIQAEAINAAANALMVLFALHRAYRLALARDPR
jgi:hypothetical protein